MSLTLGAPGSRSSRTDKGVHAIGCSVACKLVVPLEPLESNGGHFSTEILDEINTHLPPSIRLVDGCLHRSRRLLFLPLSL